MSAYICTDASGSKARCKTSLQTASPCFLMKCTPAQQQSRRGSAGLIKSVCAGNSHVHTAQILIVMVAVLGGINCTDPKVCHEDC